MRTFLLALLLSFMLAGSSMAKSFIPYPYVPVVDGNFSASYLGDGTAQLMVMKPPAETSFIRYERIEGPLINCAEELAPPKELAVQPYYYPEVGSDAEYRQYVDTGLVSGSTYSYRASSLDKDRKVLEIYPCVALIAEDVQDAR